MNELKMGTLDEITLEKNIESDTNDTDLLFLS